MKRSISIVAVLFFVASLVFAGSLPFANLALADASGTVTFRNDKAFSDKMTVALTGLSAPASGSVYVGWLVSDDGKTLVNTGPVTVAADGTASSNFTSPKGDNLIGLYNKYIVTSEAQADAQGTTPKGQIVAEADSSPADTLAHVRHVIYQWSAAPNNTGFSVGVLTQSRLLSQHGHLLQDALTAGNMATVKQHAEHIVNIVEGSKGPNYGDLDKNGAVQNPGDGFGLLQYALNSQQHATFAASTPDATAYVKLHATHVSDTGQNVIDWATAARDDALKILAAADTATATPLATDLVKNADLALNGVSTQPVKGQGGALTNYEHAQNMGGFNFLSKVTVTSVAALQQAATASTTTAAPAATTATTLPKSGDRLPLDLFVLAGGIAIVLGLGLRRLASSSADK